MVEIVSPRSVQQSINAEESAMDQAVACNALFETKKVPMINTDRSPNAEFVVDRNSPLPYYAQVKEALREQIERGSWKPGNQLPGEPELCGMFGVSRTVIRQALAELGHDGVVIRKKGKGTFIAEPKIIESLVQKLTGFYQDMADQGNPPVSHVLKQSVVPASAEVAAFLKLAPATLVIEIERLRFVKDTPIVLVTSYIPYSVCPDLIHTDLTHQSLYAVLEKQFGLMITRGHRTIEAVPANQYESELLRVEKGAPLMLLESASYLSNGTPVEYYHALHRGDRSRFEVELIRVREPGGVRGKLVSDAAQLFEDKEAAPVMR